MPGLAANDSPWNAFKQRLQLAGGLGFDSTAELAAWLVAEGRTAEATPLLDQAIETFESLRAAPALSRALELRAAPAAAARTA